MKQTRSKQGTTVHLPDGEYVGRMTGYTVIVGMGYNSVFIETEHRIRGEEIPCKIKVEDGIATITIED